MIDQSGLWWWWCLDVSFAGLHRATPSPCTPIFNVSQAEIDRSPWVVWWSIPRWQDTEDACCCLRVVCLLITFWHCWLRNRDCWKRLAEDFSKYILKVYWSASCLPSCLQSLLQNQIELKKFLLPTGLICWGRMVTEEFGYLVGFSVLFNHHKNDPLPCYTFALCKSSDIGLCWTCPHAWWSFLCLWMNSDNLDCRWMARGKDMRKALNGCITAIMNNWWFCPQHATVLAACDRICQICHILFFVHRMLKKTMSWGIIQRVVQVPAVTTVILINLHRQYITQHRVLWMVI